MSMQKKSKLFHSKFNNDSTARLFELIRHGEEVDTIQALLQEDIYINARDLAGHTPLMLACLYNRVKIVDLLIKSGANVNVCVFRKLTVFHYASRNGWEEIVRCLVKKVSDLNARDHRGETAMHYASRAGHLNILKCLLDEGADTDIKNFNGSTPLVCAAEASQKGAVDILLISANVDGDEGRLLYYASLHGWTEMVRTFVKVVPDLNEQYTRCQTALHAASIKGHLKIVKCLVKAGTDTSTRDILNETVLYHAVNAGQLAVVKWYIKKRLFDLNERDACGETVLHYASQNGHLEVVQCLVEGGSHINAKNYYYGETPLQTATKEKHKKVVDWLICAGADIDVYDRKKCTVLYYASQRGWLDTVQSLASQGCDLDARNEHDVTALGAACGHHHLDIAQYLLQAGASWDVASSGGSSPFDYLSEKERMEMFIESGGHVKPVDYYLILQRFLPEVLQDVKLCSRAIVSRFNNYDLPELYKLPVCKSLPRMENFQIASDSEVVLEMERTVEFEIETKGLCNLLEIKPMPLSVLSVKSVLEYYEENNYELPNE